MKKIRVRVNGKILVFKQCKDGWYENTKHKLAIDSKQTVCLTDPWYADYITSAPRHDFKIVG